MSWKLSLLLLHGLGRRQLTTVKMQVVMACVQVRNSSGIYIQATSGDIADVCL